MFSKESAFQSGSQLLTWSHASSLSCSLFSLSTYPPASRPQGKTLPHNLYLSQEHRPFSRNWVCNYTCQVILTTDGTIHFFVTAE